VWIYTVSGFYSIVEDRDDPDLLLVRARVKGDIQRLWPQAEVAFTPDHDYAYRCLLPRRIVGHAVSEAIKKVGYHSYKDAVRDKRRSIDYLKVWTAMVEMQSVLE